MERGGCEAKDHPLAARAQMTPPPNFSHFCVIFEGFSQIFPSTKLLCHGFEQSCSAMATQKLEERVQQHDEVVESSKLAAGANQISCVIDI